MNYKNKITTVDDLINILKGYPNKSTVMAHGVFDVCHIGHIRHLTYAKEKADILITSVTADKFIEKGFGRPYVPENLRAINMAALEIVDYVIIDYNSTPIENILKIKPTYFCKGFEYKDIHNPKTKEEINAVNSYGGKVIFSPGDVVYSSTRLLSIHKPKISIEKLISLMESEGVTWNDVKNTINRFNGVKVLVIGDIIVDRYSYCSLLGPTTKTPTFSVKLETEKDYVGGAGIVAKHLKSLGADVKFVTVLGNDKLAEFVRKDLNEFGVTVCDVVDPSRPTTLKNRFWADGYKMLQVDSLNNSIVSNKILDEICNYISSSDADIVVFSDFRHGICHKSTIPEMVNNIPVGTMKVADSQVSNRWGNILEFSGFDMVFPNEKEARFALADQDSGIRSLGANLYKQSKSKYLVLKLGEKGAIIFRGEKENPRDFFMIDSFVENLVDPNGSGDAMLSATSIAHKVSGNILVSSIIGSLGASVSCETEGNVPITTDRINNKINNIIGGL